ncbi:MAG: hypothetical protein IPN22_04900 [Bacteroidetes bacterium]|nr:hypothetical protein [Bacteroidota bacterium]
MKKYFPYIAVVAILAAASGYVLFKNYYKTPEQLEAEFAVKDESLIHSILLLDNKGGKLELAKKDGRWMVNNKYEAREELIKYLMEALTRIASLAPVPNNAHDNVVRDIMNEHIKVQLYDAQQQLIKSYWVGDASLDNRGTYMLMEMDGQPAARPHIAYLPGYQGYITPRFNTDEEVWRSRKIFSDPAAQITELTVQYFAAPEKSFHIQRTPVDSLQVNPLEPAYSIQAPYEQKYVQQYLDFYTSISMEAFDNTYSGRDSLLSTTPYCRLSLTNKNGEKKEVNLYRMPINKRSKTQYDLQGKEIDYDIDRFYASVNGGKDFVIVQYYVFGKLLREYKDFFYKPG